MTIAALLGRVHDELVGLDCETCTPEMQRQRGCGAAPISWSGERWQPGPYLEAAEARGYTDGDVVVQAEAEYKLASLGEVWDRLGWLWPCCPRWFLREASPLASMRTNRVLSHVRARRAEDPTAARQRPLTAAGLEAVERTHSMWVAIEADIRERERDRG